LPKFNLGVEGLNFFATIGDGVAPSPIFTNVSLIESNSLFFPSNNGNEALKFDGPTSGKRVSVSATTKPLTAAAYVTIPDATVQNPNGVPFARVTVDTTGIFRVATPALNQYALNLSVTTPSATGPQLGKTGFYGDTDGIHNNNEIGNQPGFTENVVTNGKLIITINGDANLDGQANFTDLGILLQNYNKTGKTWKDGNFNSPNTTGVVDFADLGLLLQNYNKTAGSFSALAEGESLPVNGVPEPSSLVLVVIAIGALAAKRGLRLRGMSAR
jgi:hypothetical protein